ncbi:hypothetical protein LTR20_004811 [Exophiala xenobiotica]|nr:hypothetical protein LTR41_004251 [Exophiala xenobiotica]KAK5388194.1 hypothetical protein LTS13_001130 [Exophiala xenobiotica]KAK5398283.1 hypothetical protein LTR79_004565 [Exophiala xenobiotica]KAK5409966.1 hypothetical protein LTR06_006432 [Exophiala xenobiotica]KAK5417648.1 hypothetical protein LTR90_004822 [Exophiala xenobiotica]
MAADMETPDDDGYLITWEGKNDPANPMNWTLAYKSLVIAVVSFNTWVVIYASTSFLSGMPGMKRAFDIEQEEQITLGVTVYLLGLACGCLVLAPMSEVYGRRPIFLCSIFFFALLTLPCALATSLKEILIARFFAALFGSAMLSNSPGTVNDIVPERYRAAAYSCWSLGPLNGPATGPIIGGFVFQYLGWRWTEWIIVILAGAGLLLMLLVRETYQPGLLRNKAADKRKASGDGRWHSRYDETTSTPWQILKTNLSRPLRLAVTEPILIFWNLYTATIYGILYLSFVAYPIIFSDIRGWKPGPSGAAFTGVSIGTIVAIISEPLLRRLINSHKPDPHNPVSSSGGRRVAPEAMVSVLCIAAIVTPLGQIWFAWTSAPASIHWIWPVLAGVPFGAGNTWANIYSCNYMAQCYGMYAASALATNAVARSLMGAVMPLVGKPMYATLGPNWAGTLLGLLMVLLAPIPFVFYRDGGRIREKSTLIRNMQVEAFILAGESGSGPNEAAAAAARHRTSA